MNHPLLTSEPTMIDISIMKVRTANVADLRNNFRRVSAWLENGEPVEIVKRGRLFARLTPATLPSSKPPKIDFARQLQAVWGRRIFSDQEMRAMRDSELGTQS
jgi:antitoxin (DNA-binding transcriptional repressor) of toxin-antitoxin stability system